MTYESYRLIVLAYGSIEGDRSTAADHISDQPRKFWIYFVKTENPRSPLKKISTSRLWAADFTPCHWMSGSKKRKIEANT
jgi:hypothetical protein